MCFIRQEYLAIDTFCCCFHFNVDDNLFVHDDFITRPIIAAFYVYCEQNFMCIDYCKLFVAVALI